MGVCSCYRYSSQGDVESQLQCLQFFCSENKFKQLQIEPNAEKLMISIRLAQKQSNFESILSRPTQRNPINESEIVGQLEQNGIYLRTHNTFETHVKNLLLKVIKESLEQADIVIFMEQPLCSNKVAIHKIYEHVFRAVLIANS